MAQAAAVVAIAIEFSIIFEAIREVFASFFHEDFFLSVASALGFGAAEGDFFTNKGAVNCQKTFGEKIAGVAGDGHLKSAGRCDGKADAFRKRIFAHNNLSELGVVDNHRLIPFSKRA